MNSKFAKRSLGQNFLTDLSIINRIVAEVAPQPEETIVEIGPGRGALTGPLVASGVRVVGIELDDALSDSLRARFASDRNFSLITDDALEFDVAEAIKPARTARVVANLPYNISTPIVQRLLRQPELTELTLMLQREMVDRISATPNDPERGVLSVFVQARCTAEKLFDVPPSAFKPAPKVWSSIVRLTPQNSVPEGTDEEFFWRLVGAGFSQRRKTILNNLKAAGLSFTTDQMETSLRTAGINAGRRAQSLSLAEWIALAGTLGQTSSQDLI
jgi:16S rRNA (adenine1518-N6/adenine1519-N6)-dimethyltransferase